MFIQFKVALIPEKVKAPICPDTCNSKGPLFLSIPLVVKKITEVLTITLVFSIKA